MNRLFGTLFIVLVLSVVGVWGISRVEQKTPKHAGDKILVATSFYPLAYLAATIGGDRVVVADMTPSGVEPHDFEPSPRDLAHLGEADVFLYNGASFEPWITSWEKGDFDRPRYVLSMAERLKSEGVNLINSENVVDPHIWLDPVIFTREAELVRNILSEADPGSAWYYEKNAASLNGLLRELDLAFERGLSSCVLRSMIVSHDAFAYPSRRYGLTPITIAGMSPDEEPSAQTLASIVDIAREKGIHHVFFETTVSPRLSETVARELGGDTLVLHTLESLTSDEIQLEKDYISIMYENLQNLRTALSCN